MVQRQRVRIDPVGCESIAIHEAYKRGDVEALKALLTKGLRLAGVLAALLLPVFAQDAGRLTFRVLVSDLGRQTGSFAKNKRPEDLAIVTLPGRLFDPPHSISLIERSRADWSTPESVIASIRSANTAGDPEWIVQNFVPAERAGVQKMLADPAIAKRNSDYYKSVRKVDVTGSTQLRNVTIMFVREESDGGKGIVLPVTLTKTSSGWKQTNILSSDDTFDVVWMALRSGSVK